VSPPKEYVSTCDYHWEHIILDECHHIKTIQTRQHQSIALLQFNSLIGLTGTLMWNRIVDLYGYWSLLPGGLAKVADDGDNDENGEMDISSLAHPEGVQACQTLQELYSAWSQVRVLPRQFDAVPYELLDPKMLVRLGKKNIGTIIGSYNCFPFLFRASIMMRSMGDVIKGLDGQDIIIGAEIPPLRVMTVEVR
jgi:hypothetical protein